MRRGRVIVAIIFVSIACLSYVFSEVYSYSLKMEQQQLENSISQLEVELDDLEVKMNMLSSRESVTATHPNLKYNGNVYYMEPYE